MLNQIKPFVVVFILLAFSEAALQFAGIRPFVGFGKNSSEYNKLYTEAIERQAAGNKICVLIGDSRVEWGVAPEVVQEGLGDVEVFNLAYPGCNAISIVDAFCEAGFFPDILICGYSDLSFVWSKKNLHALRKTRAVDVFDEGIHSWLCEHLAVFNVRLLLSQVKDGGAWIRRREITKRGQALISYAISYDVAVGKQRDFYEKMYKQSYLSSEVDAKIESFKSRVRHMQEKGCSFMLIRMPVDAWALKMESENMVIDPSKLALDLKVPYFDLNGVELERQCIYYDGLHVAPPSDAAVSKEISDFIRAH